MKYLDNLFKGENSTILLFILIFLALFGTDFFKKDCCDNDDSDDHSTMLFFVIVFLLLFITNDHCCDN